MVRRASRTPIDVAKAREQHAAVARAIGTLGLDVIVLEPAEEYPDSVFIEDTVLAIGDTAILCSSSERSRRGEEDLVESQLVLLGMRIARLRHPATIDGGDCIKAESELFVGISQRTNWSAIHQLQELQSAYRVIPTEFDSQRQLHLKSTASYLGRRTFLVASTYVSHGAFDGHEMVEVPRGEEFAANCVVLGNTILLPTGAPLTASLLLDRGYDVRQLEISEFIKGDGSMSCLGVFLEVNPADQGRRWS